MTDWPHLKRRSAHIDGSAGKARHHVTPQQAVEMAFLPAPEGWKAKSAPVEEEAPGKRTVNEWIAALPRLRFAWGRRQ